MIAMAKACRVLVLFCALLLPTSAPASDSNALFESAWAAWHQPDYPTAYQYLAKVRAEPYGKRPVVDFMLATSACRIDGVRDYGAGLLDWLLYAYALTAESRVLVAREREVCRAALSAKKPPPPSQIVELRSAGMSGYGKTFYWENREQQPVDSYPIRRVRDIPLQTFTARLVELGDESGAHALARSLAPNARVRVSGRFVLISHGVHNEGALDEIGRTLDRFVGFLVSRYGVLLPPNYLRVELVRDGWAVSKLANERHGLDVSKATVGYTFVEDSGIVAAVPTEGAGTVLHELVHLLMRSNFGDIPQWLDEGIASLYEVSGRRESEYFGLENWRRKVLESTWRHRPSVEKLIGTEWFMFDSPAHVDAFRAIEPRPDLHDSNTGAAQAAMMATARYFAFYLQEQGKLVEVYKAVRDLGFSQLEGSAQTHTVALVEATLGKPIAEVDRDFEAWFRGQRRPGAAPSDKDGVAYVTTASVNLRTGPGTGYERLSTVSAGTVLGVTGESGEWRRIKLEDGTTAFVNGRFLAPVAR